MTLRNRWNPSGFAGVTAPVMAAAMRRANHRKDLAALKSCSSDCDAGALGTTSLGIDDLVVSMGARRTRFVWP